MISGENKLNKVEQEWGQYQGKASLFIKHLSTQGNSKCFTKMKDIKKMAFKNSH